MNKKGDKERLDKEQQELDKKKKTTTKLTEKKSLGGTLLIIGSAEIIFPVPIFGKSWKTVRMSAYFDIGSVFSSFNTLNYGDFRYSVGIGAIWMSPIGGMSFSFGHPINSTDRDKIDTMQFSLGAKF